MNATGLIGAGSSIAIEYCHLGPCVEVDWRNEENMRLDLYRYLICIGYLAGKTIADMCQSDLEQTWNLNFVIPVRICERIFAANPAARICVMGSESGFAGSYDQAYAGAKAALHHYVQTKRLEQPGQMLVAVAPHVIWDSDMTQRRSDLPALGLRGESSRLGRWLRSYEVAKTARDLLHGSTAVSGSIIRMRNR